MAVTKRDLVKKVSVKTGLTIEETMAVVQAFLNEVTAELGRGNRIEFREFGIFEVKPVKPRISRNPRTGEAVSVPAGRKVHFKPGRMMKKRVTELL